VSELAFRRHLILHHQVMMETRDGSESFRRMDADEAAQRSHTVRNRRRGRQCRLQAEAASCRPTPAAEAAPCRLSPDDRATIYLPSGYLSDTSSDEYEFETSQPEGMESMLDLSFVCRTSVSAAPIVPPRQTPPEATPRQFVDTACDARPLTPPPPPPPPQVVEVVQVNDADLERPLMTPREMAAAVAAIMTAVPSASPSAVVDRLCNALGSVVPAPQRETMNFSVQFALQLHRELWEFLFRDLEVSFGQLQHMDNHTVTALLRFLFETLAAWHGRRAVLSNGPAGPGPRAPSLRGPQTAHVLVFIS